MIDGMLHVWDRQGCVVHYQPSDVDLVESAIARLLGDGAYQFSVDERDSLVRLTTMCGEPYRILALLVATEIRAERAQRSRTDTTPRAGRHPDRPRRRKRRWRS
jgi:hypothetical protein